MAIYITGYKWDYTFYNWGYKYLKLINGHNCMIHMAGIGQESFLVAQLGEFFGTCEFGRETCVSLGRQQNLDAFLTIKIKGPENPTYQLLTIISGEKVRWERQEKQRRWWRTGCLQELYVNVCESVVCQRNLTESVVCERVGSQRVVSERVVCSRGVCVCDRVVSERVVCSRGVCV